MKAPRSRRPPTTPQGIAISRGLRRYWERRRSAERVQPRDLLELARVGGPVKPNLRPFAIAGAVEAAELIQAKGGPEIVSPMVRIACEDCGRLGAVLRGLVTRWAQTGDPELASRCASVASARRGLLALIGLERAQINLPSLDSYLRAAQTAASHANGEGRDPAPTPDEILPPERTA